jgi:large subunit ribosomal protein L9
MPAGANGKLYGAVTNQTLAEVLSKDGFDIERKRIDIPRLTIKHVGKYSASIRLYESTTAEISIIVKSQEEAAKEKAAADKAAALAKEKTESGDTEAVKAE